MKTGVSRIDHLLGLLGSALLLPWPTGSKGYPRKWGHLQLTDMDRGSYRAGLERAGNIGVALGQVSNGLVTIDLDHDTYVEAFLAANPPLRDTLRTTAARGCNIWLRCGDGYPASRMLKNPSGQEIGEWRADGNQTIISGNHPEGVLYRFVVEKPVITTRYEAIIWPESISPPSCYREYESKRVGEYEVVGVRCVDGFSLSKVGDLISQIAPRDFHQNNASLFNLARLVVSYQNAVGRVATEKELEFVFDRWCLLARSFWRHTRDDYWAEFLQAYHYARIGLDQDPLELALNCARAMPLPIVPGFSDERVRLLAAICRELQRQMRDGSFFLPTRKLGRVLGAHWGTVARWLVALEALGVIRLAPGEIRKRGGTRCPRYQYCQSLDGEPQPKLGTVTVPQLNGGNGADEPLVSLADQYPQLG
jgi:Bifunctional DNA primase/polymerase, N-terminal